MTDNQHLRDTLAQTDQTDRKEQTVQMPIITPFHRNWDEDFQLTTYGANVATDAVLRLQRNGLITGKAAMLAIRDIEGRAAQSVPMFARATVPAPSTTSPDVPVGTGADDAEAVFQAVRALTGDGRIRGYIGRKATMAAAMSYTRVSDIGTQVQAHLDDICQDLTLGATERILRYRDNPDFYPVYAEAGQDGTDFPDLDMEDDAPNLDIYVHTVAGPVIGWYVRIGTPCGVCDKCPKSQRCDDKSYRWEFFTVRRVVFAMVQAVCKRHFRPDMNYLDLEVTGEDGKTVSRADVPIDLFGHRVSASDVNVPDVHPDPIAPGVRRIVRKVSDTLDAAGLEAVHPANGRMTADAGNVAAMLTGHAPTENGRREAYGKIRRMQASYARSAGNV